MCNNEQLHLSNFAKTIFVGISESRTVSVAVDGTMVISVCLNDEPDEFS